jgi:hypothetical protein
MCKEGKQTCQNGAWGTCLADIQPVKEICDDKLDNDCDGQIDEDCLNPPALDLQKVVWLHTNVSQWKQTSNLKSVTFGGGRICLNHTHAQKWPTKKYNGTTDVAANPWVFIYHNKKWYGATWEWMRPGQMCKNITSVAGDHIKRSPFGVKSDGTFWKPKKGQVLYFMVSGLARDTTRNALERTNPVRVTWP